MTGDCNIRRNAIELNKNLQRRPTLHQLANNGIYPPLNGPIRYSNERKKLIIAQTKDYLQHKFENRPERVDLQKQSILISSPRIDSLVSQRVPQLKRSFLETNLNVKLKERPGPLELVAGNILKPDDDMLLNLDSDELLKKNGDSGDKEVKLHCSRVVNAKCGNSGLTFYYYGGSLVDKKNTSRPKTSSDYIGALEQQQIYLSAETFNSIGSGDSEFTERISYFMDNFTVSELKDKLRKCNAILRGRKLDLARRLARLPFSYLNSVDSSPCSLNHQRTVELPMECEESTMDDFSIYNSPLPAYSEDCWF